MWWASAQESMSEPTRVLEQRSMDMPALDVRFFGLVQDLRRDLLTVAEAARSLGRSHAFVSEVVHREVQSVAVGTCEMFRRRDLDVWELDQNEPEPDPDD